MHSGCHAAFARGSPVRHWLNRKKAAACFVRRVDITRNRGFHAVELTGLAHDDLRPPRAGGGARGCDADSARSILVGVFPALPFRGSRLGRPGPASRDGLSSGKVRVLDSIHGLSHVDPFMPTCARGLYSVRCQESQRPRSGLVIASFARQDRSSYDGHR